MYFSPTKILHLVLGPLLYMFYLNFKKNKLFYAGRAVLKMSFAPSETPRKGGTIPICIFLYKDIKLTYWNHYPWIEHSVAKYRVYLGGLQSLTWKPEEAV